MAMKVKVKPKAVAADAAELVADLYPDNSPAISATEQLRQRDARRISLGQRQRRLQAFPQSPGAQQAATTAAQAQQDTAAAMNSPALQPTVPVASRESQGPVTSTSLPMAGAPKQQLPAARPPLPADPAVLAERIQRYTSESTSGSSVIPWAAAHLAGGTAPSATETDLVNRLNEAYKASGGTFDISTPEAEKASMESFRKFAESWLQSEKASRPAVSAKAPTTPAAMTPQQKQAANRAEYTNFRRAERSLDLMKKVADIKSTEASTAKTELDIAATKARWGAYPPAQEATDAMKKNQAEIAALESKGQLTEEDKARIDLLKAQTSVEEKKLAQMEAEFTAKMKSYEETSKRVKSEVARNEAFSQNQIATAAGDLAEKAQFLLNMASLGGEAGKNAKKVLEGSREAYDADSIEQLGDPNFYIQKLSQTKYEKMASTFSKRVDGMLTSFSKAHGGRKPTADEMSAMLYDFVKTSLAKSGETDEASIHAAFLAVAATLQDMEASEE